MDWKHRVTAKTFRACFNCARARVRCTGDIICERCDTRSLECQYPSKRRSKAKALNEASKLTSESGPPDPNCPRLSSSHNTEIHTESSKRQPAAVFQALNFSADGMEDLYPPLQSSHTFTEFMETQPDKIPSLSGGSDAADYNFQLYLPSSNRGSSPTQIPWDSHPSGASSSAAGSEIANSEILELFSVELTAAPVPVMGEMPPDIPVYDHGMDMFMTAFPKTAFEFESPFFDQSLLSTVNLFPDNFFTDTSANYPVEPLRTPPECSQSALPNTCSRPLTWLSPATVTSFSNLFFHAPPNHFSLGSDT